MANNSKTGDANKTLKVLVLKAKEVYRKRANFYIRGGKAANPYLFAKSLFCERIAPPIGPFHIIQGFVN